MNKLGIPTMAPAAASAVRPAPKRHDGGGQQQDFERALGHALDEINRDDVNRDDVNGNEVNGNEGDAAKGSRGGADVDVDAEDGAESPPTPGHPDGRRAAQSGPSSIGVDAPTSAEPVGDAVNGRVDTGRAVGTVDTRPVDARPVAGADPSLGDELGPVQDGPAQPALDDLPAADDADHTSRSGTSDSAIDSLLTFDLRGSANHGAVDTDPDAVHSAAPATTGNEPRPRTTGTGQTEAAPEQSSVDAATVEGLLGPSPTGVHASPPIEEPIAGEPSPTLEAPSTEPPISVAAREPGVEATIALRSETIAVATAPTTTRPDATAVDDTVRGSVPVGGRVHGVPPVRGGHFEVGAPSATVPTPSANVGEADAILEFHGADDAESELRLPNAGPSGATVVAPTTAGNATEMAGAVASGDAKPIGEQTSALLASAPANDAMAESAPQPLPQPISTPAPSPTIGSTQAVVETVASALPTTAASVVEGQRPLSTIVDNGMDGTEVWRQVQRAIGSARTNVDGDQQLTIRLRPAELGSVMVRVIATETGTNVSVVAETSAAANQLSQQRQQLADELASSGLRDVSVDIGAQTGEGRPGDNDRAENGGEPAGLTDGGGPRNRSERPVSGRSRPGADRAQLIDVDL